MAMMDGEVYFNLPPSVCELKATSYGRGGPPELVPMILFEKMAVREVGVCDMPYPKITISVPPAREAPLTP